MLVLEVSFIPLIVKFRGDMSHEFLGFADTKTLVTEPQGPGLSEHVNSLVPFFLSFYRLGSVARLGLAPGDA